MRLGEVDVGIDGRVLTLSPISSTVGAPSLPPTRPIMHAFRAAAMGAHHRLVPSSRPLYLLLSLHRRALIASNAAARGHSH